MDCEVDMDFLDCRPAFRSARFALLLAAPFLSATCASCFAQQQVIGSVPVQPAAPQAGHNLLEAGDIYLPSSRVYVFVGKTGFGHEHGVVGQLKQGRINMVVPAGAAQREVGGLVFDMASFVADTPEARKFVGLQGATDTATQQQVNANMRGPDVLDVARFPAASFTVKQITNLNQLSQRRLPQYQLDGEFTLHGVTRPIRVVAEAEDQAAWIHLMGGFTMQQSQFGITPFTKAFGAVGVTDQLTVWGDLWISKQRQVASRPGLTK
jgi:hypothetical protein